MRELGPKRQVESAACETLLRHGSRTFFAASRVLPPSLREPAAALYAFCRLADDAIDLERESFRALTRLRERLDRIYAGRPSPHAVDHAFARVVERFAIPRALPAALLEGFEWDAIGRRYPDLAALHAYAARVAGSVGAMMALLMGARAPDALARACDLGIAMQLTNIARDVGEDARAGRLYLPLQWLQEAGVDPDAWLARPVFTDALGTVIERLLTAADALYERAGGGIAQLPSACRPAINAARLLYAEIGGELRRQGRDSVSRRAVVPAWRKTSVLLRALATTALLKPGDPAPPLDQARFLVAAVSASQLAYQRPRPSIAASAPWWNLYSRLPWLLELFERLERNDRASRLPAQARRASSPGAVR